MKKQKFTGSVPDWISSFPKGTLICGIDEAGRGPLAGPVTAAAVILPADFPFQYLDDSKKLSEKKRFEYEILIKEKAVAWGVGNASNVEIDETDILQATLEAMKRAFLDMKERLASSSSADCEIAAIIDGIFIPDINIPAIAVPKADANYYPVMAASILAKTARDRIMLEYDALYPEYGYAGHKGYPTKAHREICQKKGPSPIQRRTFKF